MADKKLVRAMNRSGVATGKRAPAERGRGRPSEPTVCSGCGAVFTKRMWRRPTRISAAVLARALWRRCPACRQIKAGAYRGLVIMRGKGVVSHDTAIRRRIKNVSARAQFTQPQRQVISAERDGEILEVRTTSQKLAHRIVHELTKAFRGRATYHWADDGTLVTTWSCE